MKDRQINESNFCEMLSKLIRQPTNKDSLSTGTDAEESRDEKFARIVQERIARAKNGWAIIIVGGKHAENTQGSMLKLLEDKGYDCKVKFC